MYNKRRVEKDLIGANEESSLRVVVLLNHDQLFFSLKAFPCFRELKKYLCSYGCSGGVCMCVTTALTKNEVNILKHLSKCLFAK